MFSSANYYLASAGVPHFESVVIAARHNGVARELQAGYHVVVVTLQHLGNKFNKIN